MVSKEVYDREIMPLIHQLVQKAREHAFPSLIAVQVDQAVYIRGTTRMSAKISHKHFALTTKSPRASLKQLR